MAVEFYSSFYSREYEENEVLMEMCGEVPQVSAETHSWIGHYSWTGCIYRICSDRGLLVSTVGFL